MSSTLSLISSKNIRHNSVIKMKSIKIKKKQKSHFSANLWEPTGMIVPTSILCDCCIETIDMCRWLIKNSA